MGKVSWTRTEWTVVAFGLLVLLVVFAWAALAWRHRGVTRLASHPLVCASNPDDAGSSAAGMYVTAFPLSEAVISEGGRWYSGKSVGFDWSDVRTTPGLAFGVEAGTDRGAAAFNDSTALLA